MIADTFRVTTPHNTVFRVVRPSRVAALRLGYLLMLEVSVSKTRKPLFWLGDCCRDACRGRVAEPVTDLSLATVRLDGPSSFRIDS